MKKSLLFLVIILVGFYPSSAQLNIDKVKNIFGAKNETSKLDQYVQNLRKYTKTPIYSGSAAEAQVTNYLGQEFNALLFKPYLGRFVHRFDINKRNNLSDDSYIKIFNKDLDVGHDVIIPPFSGSGAFYAQALPGMEEAENLWFIKFTDVGVELNNKHSNGLEKMYRAAKDAFAKGAEAVMFINDDGKSSDFTSSFLEKKSPLAKPVFILNHAAYKKHIIQGGKGKEWIHVDYSFSKIKRRAEGHNAIGFWQNQTAQNIVIAARVDEVQGVSNNISGLAALLEVAEAINKIRPKKYNYIVVGLSGTSDELKGAKDLIKKLRLTKKNTSAVIHIDDIGALNKKNELFISGVGTSPEWEKVLDVFTRNFLVQKIKSGEVGNVNHRAFYDVGIPAINIFTKRKNASFNRAGIAKVVASIGQILAQMDQMPSFSFTKTKPLPDTKKLNFKVTMGIIPDYAFNGRGLLIGNVKKSSAAQLSNVKPGDVLIRMAEYDIRDVNDYVRELAKYKKGDRLMIKVKRSGKDKQMLITFK